jgi:hypothetical protein
MAGPESLARRGRERHLREHLQWRTRRETKAEPFRSVREPVGDPQLAPVRQRRTLRAQQAPQAVSQLLRAAVVLRLYRDVQRSLKLVGVQLWVVPRGQLIR